MGYKISPCTHKKTSVYIAAVSINEGSGHPCLWLVRSMHPYIRLSTVLNLGKELLNISSISFPTDVRMIFALFENKPENLKNSLRFS